MCGCYSRRSTVKDIIALGTTSLTSMGLSNHSLGIAVVAVIPKLHGHFLT